MDSVNKTLYIPLYGKSYVSRKGLFLSDPKAEEIWAAEGFRLKGKAKGKWLSYYMGIRAAAFDDWAKLQMKARPDAVILQLGCGLDSRCLRVDAVGHRWYDVDLPEVIEQRMRYYKEDSNYRMLCGDIRQGNWLESVPETDCAIVLLEGVSMYLSQEELQTVITRLNDHFKCLALLVDVYTPMAARLSKYKNPVHGMGVSKVFGLSDPKLLEQGEIVFLKEHSMTPQKYVDTLQGMEKIIFSKLYAGRLSRKLYRLYEYAKNGRCTCGKA